MRFRRLGKTELRVSELGFGCARVASVTTPHSRPEVVSTIRDALEESIVFFDTADVYGQGDSERLLGVVLREHRDRVVLCSKAGLRLGAPQRLVRRLKPLVNPVLRRWRPARRAGQELRRRSEQQCFRPEYIRKQVEGSLRRLRTDRLDLFLVHNPPPRVFAQGELFLMLERLRQAGTIRHFGASLRTPAEIETAMQVEGISCLQLEINPLTMSRSAEDALRRARDVGLGIIGREPLAGGALLNDPIVRGICTRGSVRRSPAEIALKYALSREGVGVVIVGMTCRIHLRENLHALATPPLSVAELSGLERLHPTAKTAST